MQFLVKHRPASPAVARANRSCNLTRMRIRLSEFRQRLNITLEKMAERVDVSDSQLSRWEKGKSSIPSKRLPDLARAYECRVSEIFADDHEADKVELSPDQITDMVRLAQSEMAAGTSFADWPKIVASSLHEQLRQIQAAGGLRVSSAQCRPDGRVVQSQDASTPNVQAK